MLSRQKMLLFLNNSSSKMQEWGPMLDLNLTKKSSQLSRFPFDNSLRCQGAFEFSGRVVPSSGLLLTKLFYYHSTILLGWPWNHRLRCFAVVSGELSSTAVGSGPGPARIYLPSNLREKHVRDNGKTDWILTTSGARGPGCPRSHRSEGGDRIIRDGPNASHRALRHFLLKLSARSLAPDPAPSVSLSGLRPWLLPPTMVSMATISVPCPKCSLIARSDAGSRNSRTMPSLLASFLKPSPSSIPGSTRFPSLKVVQGSSNSSPLVSTNSNTQLPKSEDADLLEESSGQHGMIDTTLLTFMSEVSSLVELVDSKDIAELHLKKDGCEILIRKKEALPQPEIVTPPMMLQNQPIFQPQPSMTPIVSPPAPSAPSKALPAPSAGPSTTVSKSPLPALKCPMAGTFYRCPAPGEPPFVKVGDKVQKGQVVCIVEAMKLMNEIEADKSGTVVEILAEDAKPVSLDTPLLIIQP